MSTADKGLQKKESPKKSRRKVRLFTVPAMIVVLGTMATACSAMFPTMNNATTPAPVSSSESEGLRGATPTPSATEASTTADEDADSDADLIGALPEIDSICPALVKKAGLPMKDGKIILEPISNDARTHVSGTDDHFDMPLKSPSLDEALARVCSQPETNAANGINRVDVLVKQMGVSKATQALKGTYLEQFVGTTVKEYADKVLKTREISYAEYSRTANLLAADMKAEFVGIKHEQKTVWNYHALPMDSSASYGVRPVVLNNRQYTGDFLVFNIGGKGLGCVASYGINVGVNGNTKLGDQRPVGLDCEKPKVNKPVVHHQPTAQQPTTHKPTTQQPAVEKSHKPNKPEKPEKPKTHLEHKGSSIDNKWTPGKVNTKTDPETDGKVSQEQKAEGKTEGNVAEEQVTTDTKSDKTTPDHEAGTITAPGATSGGDPRPHSSDTASTPDTSGSSGTSGNTDTSNTDPPIDHETAIIDNGGTNGVATCVPTPGDPCVEG